MLRVGILGTGFMGAIHAAAWRATPADVIGYYSLEPARAAALAAEHGGTAFDSAEALIAACDVIDICTPTHLHADMIAAAADAGRAIVCEKPLARTYADALASVERCERAGVPLLVAHVVRFFPEYARAKALVDAGAIGRVAVIRTTRASFQPRRADDNWFLDDARSGGMILDLMIHDFDYARWVAGEVESVYARSVRGRDPGAAEDYAIALLTHTGGAMSNIEGGWAYPQPMFRTALEIAGDDGLIEHPAGSSQPLALHLKASADGSTPDTGLPTSPLAEDPYTTEIRHFYDVLVHGAEPRVTARDGLAAVRIALAAHQSARTGKPVRIEEISA
jgi:predicted dehydrogenase